MDKELQYTLTTSIDGMYTIVSPVRDKWKDIGLKLGLFATTLENIDKCNDGSTDRCLYSVLNEWLRRKDDVPNKGGTTWKVLIQVLESVGADENVLKQCRSEATDPKLTSAKSTDDAAEPAVKKNKEENTKPKLRDLVKLEVAPEWYSLGLQLGLTEDMLNIIETDDGRNSTICRRKMFSKWLSTNNDACYTDLVKALIAIDKNNVAENVSQKFLGKSIYNAPVDQSVKPIEHYGFPKDSKLLRYLLSRYSITTRDEAEWPATVQMEYISLSLITSTKRLRTLKSMNSTLELTKQGNVQHILEQSNPISLGDVLNYDADKKVILIEGAPGVGKTTLTNKICAEWAKKQILKEFLLVMRFPLRQPLIKVAESLEDLFSYFEDNCSDEDIKYIKGTQGSKVLLILDGWDELRLSCRGKDMFFPRLVKGDILPNCSIVVTSRSGPTDFIKQYAPHPRLIEVLGFTQEQIKHYIRAYFKQEGSQEAGEKLLEDLAIYPNVANACYIAINLTIVCYVYCVSDYNLPPTLTEVYEAFVVHAVLRYLKKLEILIEKPMTELNQIDELQDLDDTIKAMLKNLGQLALEGISSDDLCFPQRDLFNLCKPDESIVPFDGYGLLKILKIPRKFRTETYYHFLHLTIQEWLAAHYLAQLTNDDLVTWLGKNHDDHKYKLVIQFFSGIDRFQSPSLCSLVASPKIDFSVCVWVFEGQWEEGCEKIAKQMNNTFQLGMPSIRHTLQPYDCMVLLYVLRHSNTLWRLTFTNIQLTDQGLANMCDEFISLPNLLHNFTIEKVNIQPVTAAMLGKIVQSQLKLACLFLTQTDLDDSSMSAFCDELAHHKTLEDFNVSSNNLTAVGAKSLSTLLPRLTALKQFDVSHNNIEVEGCNYIIDAVNKMRNCPLWVLRLPNHIDLSMLSSLVNKEIAIT